MIYNLKRYIERERGRIILFKNMKNHPASEKIIGGVLGVIVAFVGFEAVGKFLGVGGTNPDLGGLLVLTTYSVAYLAIVGPLLFLITYFLTRAIYRFILRKKA